MSISKTRVIHIRLRPDVPYEQHLQRALQDLPHGYIKRVIIQLLRSVVPETSEMLPQEQIRQALIDVADKGIPLSAPPQVPQHHSAPSPTHSDTDPIPSEDIAPRTTHDPKANALPSLISGRVP